MPIEHNGRIICAREISWHNHEGIKNVTLERVSDECQMPLEFRIRVDTAKPPPWFVRVPYVRVVGSRFGHQRPCTQRIRAHPFVINCWIAVGSLRDTEGVNVGRNRRTLFPLSCANRTFERVRRRDKLVESDGATAAVGLPAWSVAESSVYEDTRSNRYGPFLHARSSAFQHQVSSPFA
jgi:hypothetical protein